MNGSAPSAPGAWSMYRALVGVGLLCGLLIVGVYELTRPVIARNRAQALQRAILQVLPEARSSATFRWVEDGRFEALQGDADGAPLAHAGYDAERRLVGLALAAEGMGYKDVIRLLYGYSFRERAVIGIRVLESRETPGLGDKIETDPDFLRNFERLDVSLSEDGSRILHPIEAVKQGEREHPWQVDGITGATISSVAIADILRRSTAWWIPRIERSLADFEEVN